MAGSGEEGAAAGAGGEVAGRAEAVDFAGRDFTGLADARARALVWCVELG